MPDPVKGPVLQYVSPNGDIVETDDPIQARDRGLRPLAPEESLARFRESELDERHGGIGGTALTALEGAAAAGTFGGYDVLAEAAGLSTGERAEANPGSRLVGELGGTVGLALASGGTGLGGSLARATPGGALLGATTKLAGTGKAGLIAGSVVENAAFNAGSTISNIALTNEEFTTEAVLSSVGTGALFGAGGALVSLGLGAANKALQARQVAKTATEAAEAVDSLVAEDAAEALSPLSPNSEAGKTFLAGAERNSVEQAAIAQKAVARAEELSAGQLTRAAEAADVPPSFSIDTSKKYTLNPPEGGKPVQLQPLRALVSDRQRILSEAETFARSGIDEFSVVSLTPEELALQRKSVGIARTKKADFEAGLGHRGAEKRGGLNYSGLKKEPLPHLQRLDDYERTTLDAVEAIHGPQQRARVAQELADVDATFGYKFNRGGVTPPPTAAIPDPKVGEALAEFRAAQAKLRTNWGTKSDVITAKHFSRLAKLEQPEATEMIGAYDNYQKALHKLANTVPDMGEGFAVGVQNSMDDLKRLGMEAVPTIEQTTSGDILTALGVHAAVQGSLPEFDGPADNVLKFYLANKFLKRGARISPDPAAHSGSPKGLMGRLQRGLSGAVGARVGNKLGEAAGLGRFGKRAAMIEGSRMAGDLVHAGLFGGQMLAKATGSAIARLEKATAQLLSKGNDRKIGRVASLSAAKVFNKVRFGVSEQDEDNQDKGVYRAFDARRDELTRFMADPDAAQKQIHESLAAIRMSHPMVADKLEMKAMAVAQHAYETMPKDPGTIRTFAKSRWRPDETAINRWANTLQAIEDPIGVIEQAANGSVTPAAAEALRVVHPEHYAAMQKQLLENHEALQELPYEKRGRLSILFKVPVDTSYAPEFSKFSQKFWAERTTSEEPMDPGNFQPNEPSTAQTLLGK